MNTPTSSYKTFIEKHNEALQTNDKNNLYDYSAIEGIECCHSYENKKGRSNINTYYYRFEFQKRGTVHLHLLMWLKNITKIQHQLVRADIPYEDVDVTFLVLKLQPSNRDSLPLNNNPSGFQSREGVTTLSLYHLQEAFTLNLRYVFMGSPHMNDLNETFQSAYKRYHSCETALVRVQNDILKAIDNNKCVILLLLDLSAVFDTVDHEILLYRLQSKFEIKGKVQAWFRSYLTDRTHFVNIDGSISSVYSVSYGVPQWSVLGPLLYLLYTSPLGNLMQKHDISFHLYADNNQIYTTFSFNNDVELSSATCWVERCLSDTTNWMSANKLKLNTSKTGLLVLHSKFRQMSLQPSITVKSDTIRPSIKARNIGVTFDSTLTMSPQINQVVKGAFYHLKNIAKIKKYIGAGTTKVLIHSFVSSRLDFCNSLLYSLPKYEVNKLQSVQNAAARVIAGLRKYDHISPTLRNLHWLPVQERIVFKMNLMFQNSKQHCS